jgi:hypothetical protein
MEGAWSEAIIMNKKNISESDTRANFINPKLADSHWESIHIVREYYCTEGRKPLGNKRGKRLFLDYLLKFNNTNLLLYWSFFKIYKTWCFTSKFNNKQKCY